MRIEAILFGIVWLFFGLSSQALEIYRTGKPNDVIRPTHHVTCLAGGGSDAGWANGWRWMLESSGGGDVVIIRPDSGRGDYEKWITDDIDNLNLPKVNSVTSIVIEHKSDANNPEVAEIIQNAEMVFFSGGDQSIYISWFRHSLLEKEIEKAIHLRNIPIGGTSAGMALLAGIDFRARLDSPSTGGMITSQDALMNPTAEYLDLDDRVLAGSEMDHVVTDTHFSQRNRHGRLVGFMAKAIYANMTSARLIRGLAADEKTAFCYNQNGRGHVFGKGKVYFLKALNKPEILKEETPLTWDLSGKAIEAIVMGDNGDTFDVREWNWIPIDNLQSNETKKEHWSVNQGSLSQVPAE
jgi:cyanophycinase